MLKEALEHLLTPCPRRWRKMGYLREQIAIDARVARNRQAWAPHLEATKREIVEAVERSRGRRCVLVLGAGVHHDLPLDALVAAFERVVLADIVHRPGARRAARRVGGHVVCAEFDASGVAARLHEAGARMDDSALEACVTEAEVGLPVECGGEPDLVVSANLCSQLLLLPFEWIARRRERGSGLKTRLVAAGARHHARWLESRTGAMLLVSDLERRKVSRDGTEVEMEEVPGMTELRPPDRRWNWRLAPIPEFNRTHHLEHIVGAWRRSPLLKVS